MIDNHSVLDVLTCMFDYLFDTKNKVNDSELKNYLSQIGFDESGINKALIWLDNMTSSKDNQSDTKNPNSIRVYTKNERKKIDCKSRDFLYFMQNIGQISDNQRETIINQVMSLENSRLSLEDVKWIVTMVISNQDHQVHNGDWLEAIISDNQQVTLQ